MTTGLHVLSPDQTDLEDALTRTHAQIDGLRLDLDRLAIQVEKLLRERQHIVEVLRMFYHSDLTIHATHPVLDLCVELDPQIREGRR